MPARYRLLFEFDPGSGIGLWGDNEAARERYDSSILSESLPLTPATIARLDELLAWFDESLNWDYPPDPGPWRQAECDRFNAAARQLHAAISAELGPDYDVVYAAADLAEDPDLDAYLRDPRGFRRPGT